MSDEIQVEDGEATEQATEERTDGLAERLRGTLEFRRFTTEDVELRDTSDGGLRFTGYASTTETPYMVGNFEETFARGAFKRCLNEQPDVVFLVNHEGLPLARTKSGTMTLTEDARGLRVDADLDPEDPDVRAIVPKLRRRDLTEMSFAFRATEDEWADNDTKRVVRSATIHKGDVSIVTHGANETTSGSIRELVEDFEQRAGRVFSKEKKERLQAIKQELDDMLAPEAEAEEAAAVEAEMAEAYKITLMPRSYVETAKYRRARRHR